MATTLTVSQCSQGVGYDFNKPALDGGTLDTNKVFSKSQTFSNGTGAQKAQTIYSNAATITTGSTLTISLDSFTDPLGQTAQAMTKVHGIYVEYTLTGNATASGVVELSGTFMKNSGGLLTATDVTSYKLYLWPGNAFMITNNLSAGYTVTASTGNTFTIKNTDAASIVVNVTIWGE